MIAQLTLLLALTFLQTIYTIPAADKPTFMIETLYMDEDCSIPDRIYGYRAIQANCSDSTWKQIECQNGIVRSMCTYNPDAFINSLSKPFMGYCKTRLFGSQSDPQVPPNFQVPGQLGDFEDIKYFALDNSCVAKEGTSFILSYNANVRGIQGRMFANMNCSGDPILVTNPEFVQFYDYQIYKENNIYKVISLGGVTVLNITTPF